MATGPPNPSRRAGVELRNVYKSLPETVRVYRIDLDQPKTEGGSPWITGQKSSLPDKPSIVVLPFTNFRSEAIFAAAACALPFQASPSCDTEQDHTENRYDPRKVSPATFTGVSVGRTPDTH